MKTRQVREKLGDVKNYPSVADAKDRIAESMQPVLRNWQAKLLEKRQKLRARQADERRALVACQRKERAKLDKNLKARQAREAKLRQARFRSGLSGLWDRLRGAHRQIKTENETEAWQALQRDRTQTDELIFMQIEERQVMKRQQSVELSALKDRALALRQEKARFREMRQQTSPRAREDPRLNR